MSQERTPNGQGEDVHDLAAAYALDAVDADERARFEQHLATCGDCRREVAQLQEATVPLSEGLVADPSPTLREQLMADIARTPQDSHPDLSTRAGSDRDTAGQGDVPVGDEIGARRTRRARQGQGAGRWVLAGAAAATIAIGAIAVTQWPADTPDPSVVAVQEVLEAPDAVRSTESVDGATVTVVRAASLNRAVLLTEDMPEAPEGQDYQAWFVHDDGSAVSAGLMPRADDSRDRAEVALEGAPEGAVAVGITVEPAGGSEQPTSDPIVAVSLQG